MKIRTALAIGALVLSVSLIAISPSFGKDTSDPIVDIRFDAPYRQIPYSNGDEWAPTWGRGDVLYTGNDDGSSFGGIRTNTFEFGKLEGDDPYDLKGTSINSMAAFREHGGPAVWTDLESYDERGVRYKFATECRRSEPSMSGGFGRTVLMESKDEGRTWSVPTSGRSEPGFPCTQSGAPHFIRASEKLADGIGLEPTSVYGAFADARPENAGNYIIGRVEREKLSSLNSDDWSFYQGEGWTKKPAHAMSIAQDGMLGPDGQNWKTTNTYSVDGVLYMFITRCLYPWESTDPKHRHVWQNASIIKSADSGQTWTRPAAENYASPMFPGKRFATPYFVWYGKDGVASVDNADRYVYAVANNGFFENGDDYVLGRVSRSKLTALSGSDWAFYRGGDGLRDGSWTSSLEQAKPVLINPGRSSMTGMTYIEGLHRYVMVLWHYHKMNFEQAIKDKDLGTIVEFFEAGKPWGPWTKVKSFDTRKLGWYTPIIGQRFQKTVNSNTVAAYLYTTGFTAKQTGGLDPTLYKLNYMPITLSTKPLPHGDLDFVGGR